MDDNNGILSNEPIKPDDQLKLSEEVTIIIWYLYNLQYFKFKLIYKIFIYLNDII